VQRLRFYGGLLLVGVALLAVTGVGPSWLNVGLDAPTPTYEYSEEWADFLAPDSECPGSEDTAAPVEAQQASALCLLNWARSKHGLAPLAGSPVLMAAAARKAHDIIRCDDYRHHACGKPVDATASESGYPIGTPGVAFGENLNWGAPAVAASPRATVDAWLVSPGHRENLLHREWTEQGIALVRPPMFQGAEDARLWVSQFGSRR
jgi:uncharacterized protein YkwD